jgi:hypothetical protein
MSCTETRTSRRCEGIPTTDDGIADGSTSGAGHKWRRFSLIRWDCPLGGRHRRALPARRGAGGSLYCPARQAGSTPCLGVVVQLDPAHAELIGLDVAGILGDGLGRQFQIVVNVYEPCQVRHLFFRCVWCSPRVGSGAVPPGTDCRTGDTASSPCTAQAAAVAALLRLARARSASTAIVAASSAAATTMRAICQPGMPPATMV